MRRTRPPPTGKALDVAKQAVTARIDLRLAALTRFDDAIRARVKPIRDVAKSARQQLRSLRTT